MSDAITVKDCARAFWNANNPDEAPFDDLRAPEQLALVTQAEEALSALRAEGCEVVRWRPISEAKTDGTLYPVFAPAAHGLSSMTTWCAYHPDAGWCVDELREVTHFAILRGPEGKPRNETDKLFGRF